MSTVSSSLWQELKSKDYRAAFAELQLKRGVPFQIRAMLKKRKWTQETLAEKSGLTQGVISRAQNPGYGNLTVNTINRIGVGFDVAFLGRFVSFGEFVEWFRNLSEESAGSVESFEEEFQRLLLAPPMPAKRRRRPMRRSKPAKKRAIYIDTMKEVIPTPNPSQGSQAPLIPNSSESNGEERRRRVFSNSPSPADATNNFMQLRMGGIR
jgi:transcriptional regulator with XRE-family HTH domain